MRRPLPALFGLLLIGGCGSAVPRVTHPELVGVWYTVSAGDSVSAISERYKVPTQDIIEINGLQNPNQLEVGHRLFLYGIDELIRRLPKASTPAAHAQSTVPVRKTKKTAKKKKPTKTKHARVAKAEPPQSKGPPAFIWPLDKGVISSGYGKRGQRMHKGIDIAVKSGTQVKAVAAGKVVYSDNKQRGYGNLVILRHVRGFVTVYAHNRRNLVDVGKRVRQGTPIAEVGSTGRSTGPHLHFEIRERGKAIDPLIYLPAR